MKKAIIILLALAVVGALAMIGVGTAVGIKQLSGWNSIETASVDDADVKKIVAGGPALKKKMAALAPKGMYIVIDTGANRFYMKKGEDVIREGLVSTGSGEVLPDPKGKRQWVFDTPRGEFAVKSKVVNPYWVKPDWAFIEEGEPIPKRQSDRVVGGELGDYALGFGDGYFLHGTLYTRLLGRNVTHGCVRIGDEDLKVMFKAASIGTKIYIY